jgi:hypothetical protein
MFDICWIVIEPSPRTALPDDINLYRMLTEKEAASVIGVHYKTLRKMSAEGKGPTRIKVSERRVGYRLGDCLTYIREREALSAAPQPARPPLRRASTRARRRSGADRRT